ncbi:RNA polymerase I-specific transcription-initiation factor-domain-containing protein [Stachybotrys elegans]|uniref:RNA polymerase I-specific transcription-initiation factor-domain-containing protein n=1 Tax=Stachybotrys elegans TaxID=80388 RepID=A0A8K0SY24_9HYPO|nr:RNA polymerase I-specific transcription-initiation factor-domain-containing protein [Stachybotrys elegans]
MADKRRVVGRDEGNAGLLTYIPSRHPGSAVGALHTGRKVSSAPRFQIVGATAELYPPSTSALPDPPSRVWQERRLHNRWLLKAHPEASIGSATYQDFLADDLKRFKREDSDDDRPVLALGQMLDVTQHSRMTVAGLLAVATGESGQLLRLARMDKSLWIWEDYRDVALNLSVIETRHPEEQVLWESDGLSICQIKFVAYDSPAQTLRWLLVQKQTSTMLLQPEYHTIPVAPKGISNALSEQQPSRINPNLLVTISHHETGGNAHSDVSFIPPSYEQPPKLVIIDECGYWTVWNIVGHNRQLGKHTLRPTLVKMGHATHGLLDELPVFPGYPAERYGVLIIGAEPPSGDRAADAERTFHEIAGISLMLTWSMEELRLTDLDSGDPLQLLDFLSSKRGSKDRILDIQVSPVNRHHVFVLTTQRIYWVDIVSRSGKARNQKYGQVLAACPHIFGSSKAIRMSLCQTDIDNADSCMLYIYGPKRKQIGVYWFEQCRKTKLPQWHRHIIDLPTSQKDDSAARLQALKFQPVRLTRLDDSIAGGPGSFYLKENIRFYQGSLLYQDLSVRYCISASFTNAPVQVTLPTSPADRVENDDSQRIRKLRKRFVQQISKAFVVPDRFADVDLETMVLPNQPRRKRLASADYKTPRIEGPVMLKVGRVCLALQRSLAARQSRRLLAVSAPLLSEIRTLFLSGFETGKLPLTTWLQISRDSEPTDLPQHLSDLDTTVQTLVDEMEDNLLVSQADMGIPDDSADSVQSIHQYLCQLWLYPLAGKLSEQSQRLAVLAIVELSQHIFLATRSVVVPSLGSLTSEAAGLEGSSSQQTIPSSMYIKSSPASTPAIPSSPASSSADTLPEDGAFQRLQLLAPSLRPGSLGATKQSDLLARWPGEPGVSTQNYISSVAAANDQRFDEARKRLQRIEAKKKAHADKYLLPNRAGRGVSKSGRRQAAGEFPSEMDGSSQLPVPMPVPGGPAQIMSSQAVPRSSQSQAPFISQVTMSQPVGGAFGDRKKVKKGKKKSGFR